MVTYVYDKDTKLVTQIFYSAKYLPDEIEKSPYKIQMEKALEVPEKKGHIYYLFVDNEKKIDFKYVKDIRAENEEKINILEEENKKLKEQLKKGNDEILMIQEAIIELYTMSISS